MAKAFNPKPPKVLDDKQLEHLEALSGYLTIPQIADYFMISERTFNRIINRQPEAMARYKKGKANKIVGAVTCLRKNIELGKEASIFFFLKTQAGWSENNFNQNPENEKPTPKNFIIKEYDGRKTKAD
ncbi:hypothetical protein [Nitrosomonas ureae]|uniref:Uncharacterized protein n=1 Tax=Nitrosomonas ureae TaxID=44577 RepID=A0A286A238_9PROT|nr:hypothetical protein [Nitrosomonas ureae]SOD15955.1 hypothetical protein SAMN06297164_0161 [Nitrosomonas ureae]